MTDESYLSWYKAVEDWANRGANALRFAGTEGFGGYDKAEDHYYFEAKVMANESRHEQEISEIKTTMEFLLDALDALYFGQDLPEPRSDRQSTELNNFLPQWKQDGGS